MKKNIGLVAFAALLIAGAQAQRRHHEDPLLAPAERQSLRDALNESGELSGSAPQFSRLQLSGTNADSPPPSIPLAALAKPLDRSIGTAVQSPLVGDKGYAAILTREFDMVTPENEMKFVHVHPAPATYQFADAEMIVGFAKSHGMQVRGHTLVWQNLDSGNEDQVPEWVAQTTQGLQGAALSTKLSQILQDHIKTVAGNFSGKVYSWDVVNEAIDNTGAMRKTIWSRSNAANDPDYAYIAKAFKWAHEADPQAKLFYNDYGLESNPTKAAAVVKLISELRKAQVPIDGVGLQMHLELGVDPHSFAALIETFAAMSLEVHITELDVAIPDLSPASLSAQAALYGHAMQACLSVSACKALVVWGFSDAHSWKASQTPDLFNADGKPKDAYGAVWHALRGGSSR